MEDRYRYDLSIEVVGIYQRRGGVGMVLTQRLSEPVREGPESLLSESAVLAHIDMYSEGA